MSLSDQQKAYLKRVLGDISAARTRLKERKDEAADQVTSAGIDLNGPAGATGGRKVDPARALSEYREADSALRGLSKLESNREASAEEDQALSAIVLKEGRPALLVQNNSFKVPKVGEWTLLQEQRPVLEKIFPAVGRIEAPNESPITYFGTGFLVAPDVILTNRHVALFFIRGSDDLTLRNDLHPHIDYAQEYEVDRFQIAAIKKAVLLDDYWDLAALQVEWGEQGPSGPPLPLAGAPPRDLKDALVASVGYPALDKKRADTLPLQMQVFEGVFEKKRVAPGYTRGRAEYKSFGKTVNALQHDCSTLGGNSGSCLYNLDSGSVIGLHFAGVFLVANYAVPTWELADNPTLRALGVKFV